MERRARYSATAARAVEEHCASVKHTQLPVGHAQPSAETEAESFEEFDFDSRVRHTQLLEGLKSGYPRVREVLIASTIILLGLLVWWVR